MIAHLRIIVVLKKAAINYIFTYVSTLCSKVYFYTHTYLKEWKKSWMKLFLLFCEFCPKEKKRKRRTRSFFLCCIPRRIFESFLKSSTIFYLEKKQQCTVSILKKNFKKLNISLKWRTLQKFMNFLSRQHYIKATSNFRTMIGLTKVSPDFHWF